MPRHPSTLTTVGFCLRATHHLRSAALSAEERTQAKRRFEVSDNFRDPIAALPAELDVIENYLSLEIDAIFDRSIDVATRLRKAGRAEAGSEHESWSITDT